MLLYAAICCNMLPYAAICCYMLQYTPICCNMLYIRVRGARMSKVLRDVKSASPVPPPRTPTQSYT